MAASALADELSAAINRPLSNDELAALHAIALKHRREMSTRATAAMLGVATATVCRYVNTGRLRRSRHGHISRSSIDALLLQYTNREPRTPSGFCAQGASA